MINQPQETYHDASQWREFLLSLSSIFTLAVGTGAFLLLIVSFLESVHMPVNRIGLVMSFFSGIQAVAVFLIGKYYRGTHFRLIVILAIVIQSLGVFLLATLNTGLLLWIAMSLFGIGLGIILVVLYSSAIQRRPKDVRPAVSIGIYTALVAGGNAVGAYLVGKVIDQYGYSAAFVFSGVFIIAAVFLVAFMGDKAVLPPMAEEPKIEDEVLADEKNQKLPLWKFGIAMALIMSALMSVFDTLLPIYGMRAGMAMATVGAIAGFKMFMAAASRPLTGFMLNKMAPNRVSNISILGMIVFIILFPFSGMGTLAFIVAGLFGTSFGGVRVASLTSAIEGHTQSPAITRRVSHYRLSMTFGQIGGPYLAGLAASMMIVSNAFILMGVLFFVLFLITLLVFQQIKPRQYFLRSRKMDTTELL